MPWPGLSILHVLPQFIVTTIITPMIKDRITEAERHWIICLSSHKQWELDSRRSFRAQTFILHLIITWQRWVQNGKELAWKMNTKAENGTAQEGCVKRRHLGTWWHRRSQTSQTGPRLSLTLLCDEHRQRPLNNLLQSVTQIRVGEYETRVFEFSLYIKLPEPLRQISEG